MHTLVDSDGKFEIARMTTEIITSYASSNPMQPEQLTGLISKVYATIAGLANEEVAEEEVQQEPAVSIRASIKPDYLVCLEDGKRLKMLKRYLRTNYEMTPDDYRQKWNLPSDYPMVAPNYAKMRAEMAKEIGLGNKGRRKKAIAA